jgi:glycosyltransferase involved in cell wall biosynthesis
MRIGMMADVYKPYVSGITNHIALTKRFLEAAGHEVFIFTFGEEDHYEDDEPNVIRSPGLPLVDTGYYLNIRYNLPAQKLLRTMQIVHVHHPFLSGRLALRYCEPRNIPVVFTNHTRYDLYAHAYLPALPEGLSETFLRTYLPSFCASCDMVIAPSSGMQDVLRRFGVTTSVEVVPNGVDLAPMRSPVVAVDRVDLGFSAEDVLLVFTGRLGPEKNLPFLLRAFAGTAKAYDHVGLMILGSGPERENLEDRVQHMGITGRVRFTGMIPYEKLPGYLAAADAFVTASVTEVHPLSVIEAMATGLPVLGVQSPGVGDIVEDGVSGLLSEEDVAVFTAKMVRMVTDCEMRKAMAIQARLQSENYAVERTTNILLDHYQRLVDHAAGRKQGLRTRLAQLIDGWNK